MFLRFGESIRPWNKQNKYVFSWTYSYKYTYFSEHFSEDAKKLYFSSKQPVINSLQTEGFCIMQ